MKKRYEILLLDALWLSAMLLFANFWFDIQFGFNIFSNAHWNYLAVQQLTPGRVLPLFYISMVGFLAVAIGGLYFISRPRVRKINFSSQPTQPSAPMGKLPEELQPLAKDPEFSPLPKAPALPRPPKIISPLQAQRRSEPTEIKTQPVANTFNTTVNTAAVNTGANEKLKEIFENAGYTVKSPPKIGDLRLDLLAVGMDETLYIGIADPHTGDMTAFEGGDSKWTSDRGDFTSPVWRITTAAEKVRNLFSETLDSEIQIKLKAFVVMNNANILNKDALGRIWDAFGAEVFESMDALAEFMQENKNREMKSEEKEDFEAYAEYIDTVADYFNKT